MKIAQEIVVVGFSNSVNSTIIAPALTTVDQPGDKIGRTAVKYLIKEIENPGNDETTKKVEIKTSLLVHDSSFTA
ncbi:substrate-binding domain-containing protein [Maribacter sp. ANRC-HE7]|uniref:Substrate-binding domain-containing protein n=1 Tax=Maribacter aquimaris TaxID=2737171 RepID=A0ABR7V546_9FLAO|nr:substrate-binding domain-containing protein [Maribacter aquimaris]